MDDFLDFLKMILVVIVLMALCFGLVMGIVAGVTYATCNQITLLDPIHNYHWGLWIGCVVQLDNGRWIDIGDYQQIQIEKTEQK